MKIHEIIGESALTEAPIPDEWEQAQNNKGTAKVFSPKTSFKERLAFAAERAAKLGKGSSRTAFTVEYQGRPTVVKVAHNPKGLAQNAEEVKILDDSYLSRMGILIPMIDYDTEHTPPLWIHTEQAQKISKKKLADMLCCIDLLYLSEFTASRNSNKRSIFVPRDLENQIRDKYGDDGWETFCEYSDTLLDLHQYGLSLAEFSMATNWGIFDGRPAIIDVGATTVVMQKHYGMK